MTGTKKQEASKITAARYLVSRIEELGIKTVPLLQGGAIAKVIDEIGQSKKLRYISPNHEQALAMMVDAQSRLTGFGVGVVTSGPGGQNLVNGIACAFYDSTPCLFITGQVGMFHLKGERAVRQRGFQETDIVSIMRPITKYAVTITRPEDVRYEFEKALHAARSGRPGPVLIDIPYNVQRAVVDPSSLKAFTPPAEKSSQISPKILNTLIEAIKKAKRPVLLFGGGIKLAGVEKESRTLSKLLGIPTVTTWSVNDLFDFTDRLYMGNAGRTGHPSAIKAIQESDLLLALGTRFTSKVIVNEKDFAKDAKILAVDIDPGELKESLVEIDMPIQADLQNFVPALIHILKKKKIRLRVALEWRERIQTLKKDFRKVDATRIKGKTTSYISPYVFMDMLSDELNKDAIIIPDCGCNLTWAVQAYKPKVGQVFFSAWGNSPMGYSLAASLGALSVTKRPVVTIIGDGGLQMNIQELQTAITNKLPVKIFVLNNHCYGNTKFPAEQQFNGRAYGNSPIDGYTPPDIPKIAQAYGLETMQIKNDLEARRVIRAALKTKKPVLVEVQIDPKQFVLESSLN